MVAPPSVGESGAYAWINGGPGSGVRLAVQPAWLNAWRKHLDAPPAVPSGERGVRARGTGRPVPEGFVKAERDAGLFALACAWRGRGIPYHEAEQAIRESAAMCQPPVSAGHALNRLHRAYQYPEGSGG